MIIVSKKELRISGIKILPGKFNYPLDHKEKAVADQLKVLRDDMGLISFGEILYMDGEKNVPRTRKKVEGAGKKGSADSGGGKVSGKKQD